MYVQYVHSTLELWCVDIMHMYVYCYMYIYIRMYVACMYVQSMLVHMYVILCHSMCVVYPLYHGRIVDMPTCGVKPILINPLMDYLPNLSSIIQVHPL